MAGAEEISCNCNNLQGKVVVITDGAVSGVARECAEAGATVYFGFKDLNTALFIANGQKHTAKNGVMYPVPLDFDNFLSCEYFAKFIMKMEQHVDFIVLNNAGCDHLSLQISRDQYVGIWQTNYLANIVILEKLLPALRREGNHGLIFISSQPYSNLTLEDIKDLSQMKTKHNSQSRELSLKNYTRSKYALWIYAAYKFSVNKGKEMVPLIFIEPGKVSTNTLRESSVDKEVAAYKVFEADSLTSSGGQAVQTILHCIHDPSLKDNLCMIGVCTEIKPNYSYDDALTFVQNTSEMLLRNNFVKINAP